MKAIIRNETHITIGESDLRQMVAESIAVHFGIVVDPKKDITIHVHAGTSGRSYDDDYEPASFDHIDVKVVETVDAPRKS